MIRLTDQWVVPGLLLLAEWSLRWGVVLALLAIWFAAWPPRSASLRYLVCLIALAAGVLLPFAPRWGDAALPWPSKAPEPVATTITPVSVSSESIPPPPVFVSTTLREQPQPSQVPDTLPSTAPQPTAPMLSPWQLAALILAALWAVTVVALLARLAVGCVMLHRMKRGTTEVDESSTALLHQSQKSLNLSRSVRLAMHPDIGSPVVIGGLKPVVLVPIDWCDWPESHRRACLLHELSHLARFDDWAKLVQELLRAVFFFHPLVRWLLNRLDREREILCDEAAVSFGSEPIAYARLLLDLARRPGRLLPVTPLSRHGWLPFLDRRTVEVRIEHLLEKDMLTNLSRLSPLRSFLLGTVALAVALGIGSLRVRTVSAQAAAATKAKTVADDQLKVKQEFAIEPPKNVAASREVAPDELAGVVVDTDGKPIEGVEIDAWHWAPGNETKTDAKGAFRIGKLDTDRKVELVVRKAGYTPQWFMMQPTGQPGWVITLGNKTYFEGQVIGPDGKPVAGALVRANNGPKHGDGVLIGELWTETTTDPTGHYTLYAQPDVYDIQVRVPGVGTARVSKLSLGQDEAKKLDIRLDKGILFKAKIVDSITGEPVPGVRLWNWQSKGIEGRSGKDGVVDIADMMSGESAFQVDAPGYARWWSDEATKEWQRKSLDDSRGWQRNFDDLTFGMNMGMSPVTITVERAVKITGRVVDPDGKPVAGATVAPALTGTGNSITGDTRFSVVTGADGTYTMQLPASGVRDYNLVVHDGKYGEWRNWANGVLPPIKTKPGETLKDIELRLTKPATVRGRVTDAAGKPIAGREVRASAGDRLENRYYDPTVKTNADGVYELKFIRPGEQFIQVAPFWLDAREAPVESTQVFTPKAGETKNEVNFKVQ